MTLNTYLFIGFLIMLYIIILLSALKRKKYHFKTVLIHNDKNIEPKLRILLRKNPNAEFVIFDGSSSKDTKAVLEKLEYDFPEIHLISL